MPSWRLHRLFGSSDRTNRILDSPPVPWISHREWRKLTHSPAGLLALKLLLGDGFSLEEAVRHVALDNLLTYRKRKALAKLL